MTRPMTFAQHTASLCRLVDRVHTRRLVERGLLRRLSGNASYEDLAAENLLSDVPVERGEVVDGEWTAKDQAEVDAYLARVRITDKQTGRSWKLDALDASFVSTWRAAGERIAARRASRVEGGDEGTAGSPPSVPVLSSSPSTREVPPPPESHVEVVAAARVPRRGHTSRLFGSPPRVAAPTSANDSTEVTMGKKDEGSLSEYKRAVLDGTREGLTSAQLAEQLGRKVAAICTARWELTKAGFLLQSASGERAARKAAGVAPVTRVRSRPAQVAQGGGADLLAPLRAKLAELDAQRAALSNAIDAAELALRAAVGA